MDEPAWIDAAVVDAILNRQLAEHGGLHQVRNPGALESALVAPQQRWHYGAPKPDLAELAALYAFGLITNHPFADGNKRVALTAMITFLRLNGRKFAPPQADAAAAILAVAAGTLGESQLADWIRSHLPEPDPPGVG